MRSCPKGRGTRVFANKGELTVTRNWRPLPLVIPGEFNDKVAYRWNEVALGEAQIKRTVVEAELEAQAGERAEDVNRALTPHVASHAHMAQRGFFARRHLVENVAELNTEMRYHALGADAHRFPTCNFL